MYMQAAAAGQGLRQLEVATDDSARIPTSDAGFLGQLRILRWRLGLGPNVPPTAVQQCQTGARSGLRCRHEMTSSSQAGHARSAILAARSNSSRDAPPAACTAIPCITVATKRARSA